MTYKSVETSQDNGAPVELYEFSMQPLTWQYTNYTSDLAIASKTYTSSNISRSKISQTDEINRSELVITAPRDFSPADRFRAVPSSEPMIVRVFTKHLTDGEVTTTWQGRVMAVAWRGAEVELTCEPVFSSLRRPGFRRYYSYICAHSLYGPKCKVVAETYRFISTILSVNKSILQVQDTAQKAVGYFSGGYIEYLTEEGLVEQRTIISHTGSSVILSSEAPDLVGAMEISLFPGCSHILSICGSKFNNTNNYGGFPFIPVGSPFSGKTIF